MCSFAISGQKQTPLPPPPIELRLFYLRGIHALAPESVWQKILVVLKSQPFQVAVYLGTVNRPTWFSVSCISSVSMTEWFQKDSLIHRYIKFKITTFVLVPFHHHFSTPLMKTQSTLLRLTDGMRKKKRCPRGLSLSGVSQNVDCCSCVFAAPVYIPTRNKPHSHHVKS